jgi:hypothetical protein
MNTVLSTHVDEQRNQHPPSQHTPARANRVGLVDRVALHLGLALITWSRRPHTDARQNREHNPNEQRERAAMRRARDEHWQRAMLAAHPWR